MKIVRGSYRFAGAACLLLLAASSTRAQWSSPVNLSNSPGFWSVDAWLDFDAAGHVHVLYRDWWDADSRLLYIENVSGTWSNPLSVTNASFPAMRITPDQVMHVFYKANSAIWEISRSLAGGTWSAPFKISHDGQGDRFTAAAAVDGNGGLYFAYLHLWNDATSTPSALWGRYKPLGGNWGPVEMIEKGPDRDHWPAQAQLVGAQDRIIATWEINGPKYKIRQNGVWGSTKSLDSSGGASRVAVSPTGEMAAAWSKDNGDPDWYEVFVKFSYDNGATWTTPFCVSDHYYWLDRIPEIAYDANGDLHVVYQRFDCDGCQPDMWYRKHVRAGDYWEPKYNLTNTSGRTTAAAQPLRAVGHIVHLLYSDNTANGVEELFYRTTGTTPPANVGKIQGLVTTLGGHPLTGVTVTTTPGNFNALTNSIGQYTIINVPEGIYSVTASKQYHSSSTVNNVAVTANQITARDLQIDGLAPAPLVRLTVSGSNTLSNLSWQNPGSANLSGLMIRYGTGGAPIGPTDGNLLLDAPAAPSSAGSHVHTTLTNGTTYYYAAFTYMDEGQRYYSAAVTASGTPAGPGDYDRDGDVDMDDFGHFQACLTGASTPQYEPACQNAKFDDDADVDGVDLEKFRKCMAGPGQPADPNCLTR